MPTFPTLTRAPIYPLDPDGELEDAVLRSSTEAGYQQTRPKFTRARRKFGVRYKMSDADVVTLRDFERVTLINGSAAFTWTHPLTAASYTVHLAAPIRYAKSSLGLSDVSFSLEEV